MTARKIRWWQWRNVDLLVQLVHGEWPDLAPLYHHQIPALRACLFLVHKVLDSLGETQSRALDLQSRLIDHFSREQDVLSGDVATPVQHHLAVHLVLVTSPALRWREAAKHAGSHVMTDLSGERFLCGMGTRSVTWSNSIVYASINVVLHYSPTAQGIPGSSRWDS